MLSNLNIPSPVGSADPLSVSGVNTPAVAPSLPSSNPQDILSTTLSGLGNLSSDQRQLLGLEASPEVKTQQEAIKGSLDRLINLRSQLSTAQAPTEQLTGLDTAIAEQNRVLQRLTPFDFTKARPAIQDIGVTQGALEGRIAREREPIARALSDLLFSRSILGKQQEQQVGNIQAQIQSVQSELELRQAIAQLAPTRKLPDVVIGKILESTLKTPLEKQREQIDFLQAQQNLVKGAAGIKQTETETAKTQAQLANVPLETIKTKAEIGLTLANTQKAKAETQKALAEATAAFGPNDPATRNFLFDQVNNRRLSLVGNDLTKEQKTAVINEFTKRGVPIPRALTVKEKDAQPEAVAALASVDQLFEIYQKDPSILLKDAAPGFLGRLAGASKFRVARQEATDVKTRIRTGAALNDQEIAFYGEQAPKIGDSPSDVENKVNQLRGFYLGMAGLPVTVIDSQTNKQFTFNDMFDQKQRLGLRTAINSGFKLQY